MTPYPWTKDEVQIIKAAWATDQGRLALSLIVERLGNLHGASFAPDPYLTAFYEGRRNVARELMVAINNPVEKIVKEEPNEFGHGTLSATERANRAAAGQYVKPSPKLGPGRNR